MLDASCTRQFAHHLLAPSKHSFCISSLSPGAMAHRTSSVLMHHHNELINHLEALQLAAFSLPEFDNFHYFQACCNPSLYLSSVYLSSLYFGTCIFEPVFWACIRSLYLEDGISKNTQKGARAWKPTFKKRVKRNLYFEAYTSKPVFRSLYWPVVISRARKSILRKIYMANTGLFLHVFKDL